MSGAIALRFIGFGMAVAAAGAFLWIFPAAAADANASGKVCGREIRSVCPWRFTPKAITSCVEKKRARLTVPCQAFWETAKQCQAEMRVVCGRLDPFTIRSCLAKRQSQFSETCRATFKLQKKPSGTRADED